MPSWSRFPGSLGRGLQESFSYPAAVLMNNVDGHAQRRRQSSNSTAVAVEDLLDHPNSTN